MGTIYLLHFSEPICATRTTQHYLGYTDDLDTRLKLHTTGQSHARLPEVAFERGIEMVLSRTWRGGRAYERRLKNRKEGPKLCPICNPKALGLAQAKERNLP